jgi:uncharacterized protein YndB with AHSA1/START domain
METTADTTAIHKSITVRRPIEEAFALFTDGIAEWWPLEKYSIHEERATTVAFEGRVGGRLYEVSDAGEEGLWGTVTAWEPPHRLAYTWHPGRGEETSQEVEIRFIPDGDGTRLELEHRGWERAPESRAGYDKGWDFVLSRYVAVAS